MRTVGTERQGDRGTIGQKNSGDRGPEEQWTVGQMYRGEVGLEGHRNNEKSGDRATGRQKNNVNRRTVGTEKQWG